MKKYFFLLLFGFATNLFSQNYDDKYTPSTLPTTRKTIYTTDNKEPFYALTFDKDKYRKKQKTGKTLVGIGCGLFFAGAIIGLVGLAEQGTNIEAPYIIGACALGFPGIIIAGIGGNMAIYNSIKYKIARSKHLAVYPSPTGVRLAYTF